MDEKTNELTPRKVFGKRYYSADEVDGLLESIAEERRQGLEAQKRAGELQNIESSYNELSERYEILKAGYEKLEADGRELEERLTRQRNMSVSEKTSLSDEIDSLRDELERAQLREKFLDADLERKKAELEKFEKLMSTDNIALANEKAQKIIADATAESERILSEYVSQRARVVAATRSAYYNALQFKLSLAERFNSMERDLDDTIDVLRMLEVPASDAEPVLDGIDRSSESWRENG